MEMEKTKGSIMTRTFEDGYQKGWREGGEDKKTKIVNLVKKLELDPTTRNTIIKLLDKA